MTQRSGSAKLFLEQVEQHIAMLSDLLSIPSGDEIDPDLHERIQLSTRMLGNSASLLELEAWPRLLSAFQQLLALYATRGLDWDERIAQAVSELIEREDRLVSHGAVMASDLVEAVGPVEIESLIPEIDAIREIAKETSAPEEGVGEESVGADEIAAANDAAPVNEIAEPTTDDRAVAEDHPLGNSMGNLYEHTETLLAACAASNWDLSDDGNLFADIRRLLFLITFHAQAIEQIIRLRASNPEPVVLESFEPVRSTLEDFARVLCAGSDRRIDIGFRGEDSPTEAAVLLPAVRLLQGMIHDIFTRCGDEYLHIEISVEERHGRLDWAVRDNGSNFITDSRLDPDEFLAFYPSLKEASGILSDLGGVLSVEPDENRDTRFAFTTPTSIEPCNFKVWGEGSAQFAVPAHQFCEVVAVQNAGSESDEQGEFITRNNTRVPVIHLGHVYDGAPSKGTRIAVVGSVEKRIAFYVDGNARDVHAEWHRNGIPVWRELRRGVVVVGGVHAPVVEADTLIKDYVDVFNGVARPEPAEPVATADTTKKDRLILIVERSEALRNMYEAIMAERRLPVRIVADLSEAMTCLDRSDPRLIISDFRMPSMAAKALAERLRKERREIPVFVTTSHTGRNARILVEKLGVAGYLSKPLNAAELAEVLDAHCRDGVMEVPTR